MRPSEKLVQFAVTFTEFFSHASWKFFVKPPNFFEKSVFSVHPNCSCPFSSWTSNLEWRTNGHMEKWEDGSKLGVTAWNMDGMSYKSEIWNVKRFMIFSQLDRQTLPQRWSDFYERCGMCWNERKIMFQIFIFRILFNYPQIFKIVDLNRIPWSLRLSFFSIFLIVQ